MIPTEPHDLLVIAVKTAENCLPIHDYESRGTIIDNFSDSCIGAIDDLAQTAAFDVDWGVIKSGDQADIQCYIKNVAIDAGKSGFDLAVEKLMVGSKTKITNPAAAAIEFALATDEGLEFLRCWNEGDFEAIRKEWPDAPEEVYVGADPLYKIREFTA